MNTVITEPVTSNTAILRRLIEEVFNKGHIDVADEILHPGYTYTSPRETMNGVEEFKGFVRVFRAAFPDLQLEVIDSIANSDSVCTRLTVTGTHLGDFFGLSATGNSIEGSAIVMSYFDSGKIIREWELIDDMALQEQLRAK